MPGWEIAAIVIFALVLIVGFVPQLNRMVTRAWQWFARQ